MMIGAAMEMLWLLCRTSCKIIAGAARRAHSARRTPSCARRRGQHRPCWPRSDRVSALERGRALDAKVASSAFASRSPLRLGRTQAAERRSMAHADGWCRMEFAHPVDIRIASRSRLQGCNPVDIALPVQPFERMSNRGQNLPEYVFLQ